MVDGKRMQGGGGRSGSLLVEKAVEMLRFHGSQSSADTPCRGIQLPTCKRSAGQRWPPQISQDVLAFDFSRSIHRNEVESFLTGPRLFNDPKTAVIADDGFEPPLIFAELPCVGVREAMQIRQLANVLLGQWEWIAGVLRENFID